MAAGIHGALEPEDRGLGLGLVLAVVVVVAVAMGASLQIALGQNFRNRATKRENAKSETAVSERRKPSDVSA